MRIIPSIKRILKFTAVLFAAVLVLFVAISLVPITPTVDPIRPRPETQYWEMRGGYKIAYTHIPAAEPKQADPVIFLHGGPGGYIHSAIIERMRELAQNGFEIHLYDQIGSGLSDRLPHPKDYSFGLHVENLHEIVTSKIAAKKCALIGHSFGALVAAHFGANYPELCSNIVFSSPGTLQPMPIGPSGETVFSDLAYPAPDSLKFIDAGDNWDTIESMTLTPRIIMANVCAMLFNIKWASDRELDGLVNTMATKFTRYMVCDSSHVLPEEGGGGGYSHIFSNWYEGVDDPRDKIREQSLRCLVLQGQCDQAGFGTAYEYVDLFRGRYVFIEDAGHIIWWDQPDRYVTEISEFLAGRIP
jgi:proline iminopeptidase